MHSELTDDTYWIEETKKSYDAKAVIYASRYSAAPIEAGFKKFLDNVPKHGHILDLGCGHGKWARAFCRFNLNVTGIDFSNNMINIARKMAPKANFLVMNMLDLLFPIKHFDGIWANSSLCHIPKKRIPILLENLWKILKDTGCLQICLKEGTGEIFEEDIKYGGVKKFWAYYQSDEITSLLFEAGFQVKEITVIEKPEGLPYPVHAFLKIFAQKRP